MWSDDQVNAAKDYSDRLGAEPPLSWICCKRRGARTPDGNLPTLLSPNTCYLSCCPFLNKLTRFHCKWLTCKITCCIRPTCKWTWVDAVDRHLCKKLDKVKLRNITAIRSTWQMYFLVLDVFSGIFNFRYLIDFCHKIPIRPLVHMSHDPQSWIRLWKYK